MSLLVCRMGAASSGWRASGKRLAVDHKPYTPHPTPYTLHPTHFTLHPTPYTLHTSPHTPHPC